MSLILPPGGSGVHADPSRIDEGIPKSLASLLLSGQREASLDEFAREVEEWLPVLPVESLLQLTGDMLLDVVRRKGATARSLDGWGWRELKVLPFALV